MLMLGKASLTLLLTQSESAVNGQHRNGKVHHCRPLTPILYTLAFESLFCWFSGSTCIPTEREIAVSGGSRARFSAYADDIFIFVTCRSNIAVVQISLE